jgi:hypothetical protein
MRLESFTSCSAEVKAEALSKSMYNTDFFRRNGKTCSEDTEIRVLKPQVRGNRVPQPLNDDKVKDDKMGRACSMK